MNISVLGALEDTPMSAPEDGEEFIATLGSIDVDLSTVDLPESLHISAIALMGSVKVIVPWGTDVVFSGLGLMGSRSWQTQRARGSEPSQNVLYVNAIALMGSIEVVEAGTHEIRSVDEPAMS